MRKKETISAQEAAKILGVSGENIRHLAKAGIISSVTVNSGKKSTRYYYKSEILARKKATSQYVTKAQDAGRILERAEQINKEASALEAEAIARYKAASHWQKTHRCVSSIIMSLLETFSSREGFLSDREKCILISFIQLTPMEKIASSYGISTEWVRQIVEKAIRHLFRARNILERYEEEKQSNIELRKKLVILNERIAALEQEVLPAYEKKNENNAPVGLTPEQLFLRKRLLTPIRDIGFSVRTFNCLNMAGIKTIGDICYFERSTFMKIRNLGIRSLTELDITLEKLGLDYKMDLSEYGVENPSKKVIRLLQPW